MTSGGKRRSRLKKRLGIVCQRASDVFWRWRVPHRALRSDSRFPMDTLVASLRLDGDASLESIRRIHDTCRRRDTRPLEDRRGSTRLEDCYFLYLLVRRLRPRTIFEVGTLIGTSASVMAHAQVENGNHGTLHSVDSTFGDFKPFEGHAIRCFPGQDSRTVLETLRREGERIDFVFVDGTITRGDVELLNEIKSPELVVALHDYKPPVDKGIRNAWTIAHFLDGANQGIWVLPERQGVGYPVGNGRFVNSSVAVFLPDRVAQRFL